MKDWARSLLTLVVCVQIKWFCKSRVNALGLCVSQGARFGGQLRTACHDGWDPPRVQLPRLPPPASHLRLKYRYLYTLEIHTYTYDNTLRDGSTVL